MRDDEWRRLGHAVLTETCNNGNMGHCIQCDRHVAEGEAHGDGCQIPGLLAAGPVGPPPDPRVGWIAPVEPLPRQRGVVEVPEGFALGLPCPGTKCDGQGRIHPPETKLCTQCDPSR